MKDPNETSDGLILNGLDGSNPLGFLAAVGAAVALHKIQPEIRIGWRLTAEGWRPILSGCGNTEDDFLCHLMDALENAPLTVFDIDKRMPCEAEKLFSALREAKHRSSMENRRDVDFLSAFGTELYPNKNGSYQDTKFRMVRTGDNAGQGLPVYAKNIRQEASKEHIQRAVFHSWDYQDKGSNFRWDPMEDRRHALTWRNPSKATPEDGAGTMLGANSLAIEALQMFPAMLDGQNLKTTGFKEKTRRQVFFVWPIWTPQINLDTLRSVLALHQVKSNQISRSTLRKMGIEEVFQSRRIKPNKNYINFLSSQPR